MSVKVLQSLPFSWSQPKAFLGFFFFVFFFFFNVSTSHAFDPHRLKIRNNTLRLFLPCMMEILRLGLLNMTAGWRNPHRPKRRKQPIPDKGWRLIRTTTGPSLRSAGQPKPRPRMPDTNKAQGSPGAGRGNPEDRTLVNAGVDRQFQKGRWKNK